MCKGLKVGKEGSRGEGLVSRAVFMKVLYVTAHVCLHLMNIVVRL